MILLIDNYDSFVYNLAQYVGELGFETRVVRNDALTPDDAIALRPSHVLLSPGPGGPDQAGICVETVRRCAGHVPVLGVCLGHQCIAAAFGGAVRKAPIPVHGKRSFIRHDRAGVYRGLPDPLEVGRYHSLVVDRDGVPATFAISAWTESGVVMGIRHRTWRVVGVQFHPESILTPYGHDILANFLSDPSPCLPDTGVVG